MSQVLPSRTSPAYFLLHLFSFKTASGRPCGHSPYLDDRDAWLEARGQLRQHLPEQLLVLQDLPHLHDPHDRCLVPGGGQMGLREFQALTANSERPEVLSAWGWGVRTGTAARGQAYLPGSHSSITHIKGLWSREPF